MQWFKCGTTTGTGAALPVIIGFIPSVFKVTNPATGCTITWGTGAGDGEGLKDGGDCMERAPVLAIGTPDTDVSVSDMVFRIDGMPYLGVADASAAISTTTCAHSDVHDHYAAFGLQVGVNGTIDKGPDAPANNTGYHTKQSAVDALLAVACDAGHTLVGYITVKIDADGADFVGGTTGLADEGYTVEYHPSSNFIKVGGISSYEVSSGYGVSIGTDANLNVLGDTLYWEAYR
jgi:hypothetical protein